MAADNMDIDMDIDLGMNETLSGLEAEAMRTNAPVISTAQQMSNTQNNLSAGPSTGVAALELTPHKVHIRGVDSLSTDDIKDFVTEHFPEEVIQRVEWIDDNAVNVVYKTPAIALRALNAFSFIPSEGPSSVSTVQLRTAKKLSTHPEAPLEVRSAFLGDKKQPGARDRSRYYLFNPDADPGERRRREERDRSRRGGRRRYDDDADGNYERRRYNDREQRRRQGRDEEAVLGGNMYDDDSAALAARTTYQGRGHRESYSSRSSSGSGNRDRRMVRFEGRGGRELFPERVNRGSALRNRSASPIRDTDGGLSMDVDEAVGASSSRKKHRERSYTPPPRYTSREPPKGPRAQNGVKELFPEKAVIMKELFPEKANKKELFPEKLNGNADANSRLSTPIELFPTKLRNTTLHKRSPAFDAADETADLFAGRMMVPFTDGAADAHSRGRGLADRITRHPLGRGSRDLQDRITTPVDSHLLMDEDTPINFNIRGAATASGRVQSLNQGFSIRGTAAAAKELFPEKLGAAAKELFPEKLAGRGGPRRTAEDMF